MIFTNWSQKLLASMGIVPTKSRLDFFDAWARCEGGLAHFNPLNTTERVPGSTSYNSAGVQNYADPLMGIAATLLTIRLPYYRELRIALATDGITAGDILARSTANIRTWGTDPRCISRVLVGA